MAPGGRGRGAMTRPRVFIVDDHGLFRSGVRSELGDQVDVVGEADDVAPAITLIADDHIPNEVWEDAAASLSESELAKLVFDITAINAWNRLGATARPWPLS